MVGCTPDIWKPFRDSLVQLKHGALRERALACLDRVPTTSEVGDRDIVLELTDIAYAVWRHALQPALPAALPEPGPQITDEMKKKTSAFITGRAQDVLTAVEEMMDLDSKSVIQTIQADEMVTLSKFLKFYGAYSNSEGAKPFLRVFAEKLKSRADRESSQEVMDFTTHWGMHFLQNGCHSTYPMLQLIVATKLWDSKASSRLLTSFCFTVSYKTALPDPW